MKSLFFLTILLLGCASKKHALVPPEEYLRLNKLHSEKHKACIQQKEKILEKAIIESADAELDDETFFFVRNEEKALSFIKSFDVSKFTLKENQLESQAMIMACVAPPSPKYKACDTLNPTFKYLRGLVYGLRQYQWSDQTRKLALDQIMGYLKYVGDSKSSLLDVVYANDILMRVAHLGFFPKSTYKDAVHLRIAGEKAHTDLRKMIRKLSKKPLTCKDAQDFYMEERKKVLNLSEELLDILADTK